MPLEAGDLVDSPYGIGKLIRINNNDALIKYFDSPVNYEGIEQTVEIKHLKKPNSTLKVWFIATTTR